MPTSPSSAYRTRPATDRPSATSTSDRGQSVTSRHTIGGSTRRSGSTPGRPVASTISATSRCRRRWTTRPASTGSQPTSGASPTRAPGPSRSAVTTASPAGSSPGWPVADRAHGGQPVALLHLDAHADSYLVPRPLDGRETVGGHWASYLVADGRIDPARIDPDRDRGNPRGLDYLDVSRDLGYEIVEMERYREIGAEATIGLIGRPPRRIGPST